MSERSYHGATSRSLLKRVPTETAARYCSRRVFISKLVVIDVAREICLSIHFGMVASFSLSMQTSIGQRIVFQLFRHIRLQGDNYFRKDGDVHEAGIIVDF